MSNNSSDLNIKQFNNAFCYKANFKRQKTIKVLDKCKNKIKNQRIKKQLLLIQIKEVLKN